MFAHLSHLGCQFSLDDLSPHVTTFTVVVWAFFKPRELQPTFPDQCI
jgi:hypothetical protein